MAINSKTIIEIFNESEPIRYPHKFFENLGKEILDEYSDIRLIGQIERPEGKETYETLKKCLKHYLVLRKEDKTFNPDFYETRKSRAVICLYFVWTGIFNYGEKQGNELWPPIFEGLGYGYNPNISPRCGRMFLRSLEENKLERFRSIKTGAYITRILLHGLIPDVYIEKFIKNFILEELRYEKAVYETGDVIIRKWNNSSILEYQPKPLQNFIKHGRPVNADLIDRFWEMIRNWNDDDPALWWGLPKYMVDAFRKCVIGHPSVIKKKYNKKLVGAKPYLLFDFGKSDYPLLCIPPQKIENNSKFQIKFDPVEEHSSCIHEERISNPSLINDNLYSEYLELPAVPSIQWNIAVINESGHTLFNSQLNNNFPVGDSNTEIPLYFFNSNTRKLFNLNETGEMPDEFILVYPQSADVEIDGGTILTEPLKLTKEWYGWQYVICEIEKDGNFLYIGPGISLNEEIEETISFIKKDVRQDRPVVQCNTAIPSWIRCDGDIPIINDPKSLHLFFSAGAYSLWRRAVGKLVRIDSPGQQLPNAHFKLEFQHTDNGRIAYIPNAEFIQPGVYEIHIRGALGIEDLVLPFVYLPFSAFEKKISGTDDTVADRFVIDFSKIIPLEPLGNTSLTAGNNRALVFIIEDKDNGDAFCALKAFAGSNHPIILLFTRSDVRWVRRSEEGLFEWYFWRARSEDIPIQRLDEIRDSRVLIEIDEFSKQSVAPIINNKNKLRILLKSEKDNDFSQNALMSYEAPNFKRNKRHVWIIDLSKFSDQLKYLKNAKHADIIVDTYQKQLSWTLFSLLKYPEFEDFSVRSRKTKQNHEQIEVNWTPHTNDPLKNRVINFSPVDSPQDIITIKIPDDTRPPYTMDLEMPESAGLWNAQIEMNRFRFGVNRFSQNNSSNISAQWMRVPTNWADWLEWPEVSPKELENRYGLMDELANNKSTQAYMPWMTFLYLFHYGRDEHSAQKLMAIVGFESISKALPFSKGCIWEVKDYSKRCLYLEVISDFKNKDNLYSNFHGQPPSKWGLQIPKEIEIQLSMRQSHNYLGSYGTIWDCNYPEVAKEPEMTSKEQSLDLSVWMCDALDPAHRGRLVSLLPTRKTWNIPPQLPVTSKLHFPKDQDSIFVKDQPSKNTIFNKLIDPENNQHAFELLDRWDKLTENMEFNNLVRMIFRGRLETTPISTLTGAVAFICRLKAHGYDSVLYQNNKPVIKKGENLFHETLQFVRSFLPKAFLRDLILSELLISWYWNKSLYEYQEDIALNNPIEIDKNNKIKNLDLKPIKKTATISMRKNPIEIKNEMGVRKIWLKSGFFCSDYNRHVSFKNNYQIISNGLVVDHATNLMWQRSGSPGRMRWDNIQDYLNELNNNKYGGYSNWRLPTLEELGTLLQNRKRTEKLYTASVFSEKILWCWSCDRFDSDMIWYVRFHTGNVNSIYIKEQLYIRAVSSM